MRSRSSTWDVRHSRRGRATTQHVRARQSSILTSNGPISSSANAPERCHVPGDGRPSARVRRHAAPWSAWKRSPCARTRSAQLRRVRRHAAPWSAWKRAATSDARDTIAVRRHAAPWSAWKPRDADVSRADQTVRRHAAPWSAWKQRDHLRDRLTRDPQSDATLRHGAHGNAAFSMDASISVAVSDATLRHGAHGNYRAPLIAPVIAVRRHAAPWSAWKRTSTATCCVYFPRPTPRCAMERMETNTFVCGGTLISVKSDATLRPWSAWKPEAVGRAGSPTFQRRIVLSRPPLYRVRPSGLNDRPQTCPRCPTRGSDSGTFSVAISRVLRSAADGTPAVELRDQRLVGGVRLERSIEAGGDLGGAAELGGLRQDQVADRPGALLDHRRVLLEGEDGGRRRQQRQHGQRGDGAAPKPGGAALVPPGLGHEVACRRAEVARVTGRVTAWGGFLDSVSARGGLFEVPGGRGARPVGVQPALQAWPGVQQGVWVIVTVLRSWVSIRPRVNASTTFPTAPASASALIVAVRRPARTRRYSPCAFTRRA